LNDWKIVEKIKDNKKPNQCSTQTDIHIEHYVMFLFVDRPTIPCTQSSSQSTGETLKNSFSVILDKNTNQMIGLNP